MRVREFLLVLCLLIGLALVVTGLAIWWPPAALIAAGIGVAGLGAMMLVEVS